MGRVVITGLGVIAPNAHGLEDFSQALREGRSGIEAIPILKEANFTCQVAGVPTVTDEMKQAYFREDQLIAMNSSMIYTGIASSDCWRDAGFELPDKDSEVLWDTGAIIGTGAGGVDTMSGLVIPRINEGKVKRIGSSSVEQTMCSAVSAWLAGHLGLGGQVTTNSSACTTGTEAVINAYYIIREGRAKRMLAGGAEGNCHYIWGCFDAMRVLAKGFNEEPHKASRPMSATASGFVPGAGSGVLMIEDLEEAQRRGARIYAEIVGAQVNCGGHRSGGSITAPNPEGVQRCIRAAVHQAGIKPSDIDLINGHLTATMADPYEVVNWQKALELSADAFPMINSTKSMVGHALGAAGGIECVACALQMANDFVHPSINCEDVHPNIVDFSKSIPHEAKDTEVKVLAKSSFGFGDVNGCLILKKFEG